MVWGQRLNVCLLFLFSIHKKYEKLQEMLTVQNEDHKHAMGVLQQNHKERLAKMREQYVDFTASLLKNSTPSASSSAAASATLTASTPPSSLATAATGGGGAGGGAEVSSTSHSDSSSKQK